MINAKLRTKKKRFLCNNANDLIVLLIIVLLFATLNSKRILNTVHSSINVSPVVFGGNIVKPCERS